MDVRVGLWRKLSAEELMLLKCGVGEEIQPVYSKEDQPWVFFGRNDAKAEAPVLWLPHAKSWFWCWEGLGAGGEGDDRGRDGWMVSPTRWALVWVNSGTWWRTGRPGMLWFTGLQRVGHDWATELNSGGKKGLSQRNTVLIYSLRSDYKEGAGLGVPHLVNDQSPKLKVDPMEVFIFREQKPLARYKRSQKEEE